MIEECRELYAILTTPHIRVIILNPHTIDSHPSLAQVYNLAGCSWASADFFPGEGKIFQGGGKNILFAQKTLKKIFSTKKFEKHTILVGQGALRTPMRGLLNPIQIRKESVIDNTNPLFKMD